MLLPAENIVMVEGEMKEVSEADMLSAIKVAHEAIIEQCRVMTELGNEGCQISA